MNEIVLLILYSTLRVSLPLVLAALGGLMSERSGVVNIALEGMMLTGAFVGAVATLTYHSPWVGMGAAAIAGILMAALFALFVIPLKINQIVAGVAINMLASGIPPFFLKILYGSTASSPSIPLEERFTHAPLIIGLMIVVLIAIWFHRTTSGLWVKFAGEHPSALETAGIRVNTLRFIAVLTSGLLAGLGGSTLSLYLSSVYSSNMSAGRGYMALAALILGKWRPLQVTAACLLFGLFEALQNYLQGPKSIIPVQFIQMLPYLMTLVVLAGFIGHSRPPKKLGEPYEAN